DIISPKVKSILRDTEGMAPSSVAEYIDRAAVYDQHEQNLFDLHLGLGNERVTLKDVLKRDLITDAIAHAKSKGVDPMQLAETFREGKLLNASNLAYAKAIQLNPGYVH